MSSTTVQQAGGAAIAKASEGETFPPSTPSTQSTKAASSAKSLPAQAPKHLWALAVDKLRKAVKVLLDSGVVSWGLLFVAWGIISLFYDPTFFPGPIETLEGAWELILDGTLLKFSLVSLYRVFKGWIIGSIIAIPIGILIGRLKIVKQLIEPLVDYFRFIPAIAFLTLFIMWFGVGERSKVLIIVY
ncbi:MAG: hypothetical protein LBT62_08605, partial [Deltaproteobacteria bacterium]|nr:hypothetical protein [Deltaproteobacteria bacterium]